MSRVSGTEVRVGGMMATLSDLPDSVLLEIFSYLPVRDRIRISRWVREERREGAPARSRVLLTARLLPSASVTAGRGSWMTAGCGDTST